MDAHLSEQLQQIFGAYVRQEILEAAAVEMADAARAYPDLHQRFCEALAGGIKAAQAGDAAVCTVVEKSGYRAPSVAEAQSIMSELLGLYATMSDK
jgi:ABC-type nitrate/sulfonate/bicarbonate transport system substrate-binding protein